MNKITLYVLAFLAFFVSGCIKNFFIPDKNLYRTPNDFEITYEDQFIDSSLDKTRLHAWILHPDKKPLGTLLYLHGNSDNISVHLPQVDWLAKSGYRVVMVEYRGFGLSEGKADTENTISDIQDWLSWVFKNPDSNPKPVYLFGQSTGGALGIYAAAQSSDRLKLSGVISEGAFSDYSAIVREMMAEHILTWPFQWIPAMSVDNRFTPLRVAKELAPVPLLIIHSHGDKKIPLHHAQMLYDDAQQPKRLWILGDYPHIGIQADPSNHTIFRQHLQWMKDINYTAP